MGSEPSTSQGKIKVDEHYPLEQDEPPPFDIKKIENIRSDVKFEHCYEISKHIGDGKFGKVFQVKERTTGREFAAKFIKLRKEADRQEVEREVKILTQLRHPRIAQIYDAFYTTNSDVVLIMEIVRGGELFDRVADENYVLTEQAVVMIICQLCEAIEYIHQQNILHLDIKPENIMCISQTGNRIKLIDFGLARYYDGTQELKYMAGTPEFAAPEVIKFEKLDYHTDMWSVGVITYILLSGYSPFLGDNLGETYCNVERGIWEFTEEFDLVSEPAKDFISNLLVYDRRKRMLPSACLAHPWIAQHREKSQNDAILEKPGEGPKIDNKMMMRYNAKRKFRRMVIYVKFLIEMNRLRSSLRERMSEHGQKFFDPLLKMAEEKERRVALICPKLPKKREATEKAPEVKIELAEAVEKKECPKRSKTVPEKRVCKSEDGKSDTADEQKSATESSSPEVKRTKKKKVLLTPEKDSEKTNFQSIRKASEPVPEKKKTTTPKKSSLPGVRMAVSPTPSKLFVETSCGSVSDTALDKSDVVKRIKKNLKKVPSNDVLLNDVPTKTRLSTTSIPSIDITPASKETKPHTKTKKTERVESTKENQLQEEKQPARQGALRKKDKPIGNMNNILDVRPSVGEVVTKLADDVTASESKGKTKEKKHAERKSCPTVEVTEPKRTSSLTPDSTKVNGSRVGSLVHARLQKIGSNLAPIDVKIVSVPTIKKEEVKPLKKTAAEEPKKAKLITMSTEKKTTTTTSTTTSVRSKSSTTEKKVHHTSDKNSVEQSMKKTSCHDDFKVSQVTTKKEESPELGSPKTSVKKNTIKRKSSNTKTEKERREEEKGLQSSIIKSSKSVQNQKTDSILIAEKTKNSLGLQKQLSVSGCSDVTKKVEGKAEVEITPRKTSLRKASVTLTEKVKNILEVTDGTKKSALQNVCKTKIKVTPESPTTKGNEQISTHGILEKRKKSSLDVPSKLLSRDSSEETRKVRFAGDADKQNEQAASNGVNVRVEGKIKVEVKKTKDDGEMKKKKKKKLVLSKSEDVSDYVPRDEFSFDSLKEKLIRRVSIADETRRDSKKDLVPIPKTNSVKDRLKQFEKK